MLNIELNKHHKLFPEQELRKKIAEHCEIKTFAKNDIVVREDEYIKVVPIVLTGKLRVFQTKELRQILLYYVEPYQTCIMSLSAGFFNLKSTSQAIALETTEALIIPTRFIYQWQREYNSWNEFVIRTFKQRYDELLVNYESLAFDHLDKRLLDLFSDSKTDGNLVFLSGKIPDSSLIKNGKNRESGRKYHGEYKKRVSCVQFRFCPAASFL